MFGSPVFGFRENNLDFLPSMPALEQVWFWEISLKDVEGLYALKNLRRFGIHEKRVAIDFSQFPELEEVVWHPRGKDCGLEQLLKLRNLDLWRFKPKEKSYKALRLPQGVEKLEVNWSNPADLDGFPYLPRLRELQFHYCRNLASIDRIAEFAPNLRKLVVTRCANLVEFESVHDLGLEHLYVNIRGKEVAIKRVHE